MLITLGAKRVKRTLARVPCFKSPQISLAVYPKYPYKPCYYLYKYVLQLEYPRISRVCTGNLNMYVEIMVTSPRLSVFATNIIYR